jgi:hypothetical protein
MIVSLLTVTSIGIGIDNLFFLLGFSFYLLLAYVLEFGFIILMLAQYFDR